MINLNENYQCYFKRNIKISKCEKCCVIFNFKFKIEVVIEGKKMRKIDESDDRGRNS